MLKSFFNPITLIDGYKVDHRPQYPDLTEIISSNLTPRGSRIEGSEAVVVFAFQYFAQRFLMDEINYGFFKQPKDEVLKRYKRRMDGYIGPDRISTQHIGDLHDLGYLPLRLSALPEGTLCPLRVPMFVIENTLPEFFWLVNYYETILSSSVWQPMTSATSAYRLRRLLNADAIRTGTDLAFVDFQGHDFSFRGLPGIEAAAASGGAHLLSFLGTDTVPALDWLEEYYLDCDPEDYQGVLGFGATATEHSVMCAGGEHDELQTISRLIDIYPAGILSVVSDTWDLWHVVCDILPQLKDKILSRQAAGPSPGKYVTRPDSGDPIKILCGDPDSSDSRIRKGVVELLWETFGGTKTSTGHRLLDEHVGTIYGDAITYDRAREINGRLAAKGFASGNVVYGVGSYTYQYTTRDTYGFAMKATYAQIDGKGYSLFKKPVTDDGVKFSAKGRVAVREHWDTGKLCLIEEASPEQEAASLITPMWEDGKFIRRDTIDTIRERLWK